jgi:hypothetical protein
MKNAVFWDIMPCGSVTSYVSEDLVASIIRMTRIGELETLSITSNRSTLRRYSVLILMSPLRPV